MRKIRGHSGQGLFEARFVGRRREQLEVHDARGAVTQRRADAVGARVAAADHDDVLARAEMYVSSARSESSRLLVLRVRKSIA